MGFFCANLQMEMKAPCGPEDLDRIAGTIVQGRNWQRTEDLSRADVKTIFFQQEGSPWLTVVSDAIDGDSDIQRALMETLSAQEDAAILSVYCFDSDAVILNRLDVNRQVDLWAIHGNAAEVGMEDTPVRFRDWKPYVRSVWGFRWAMKKRHIFAEHCFRDLERLMNLPIRQGMASIDLPEELPGAKVYGYIMQTVDSEPPRLDTFSPPLCMVLGQLSSVRFINVGGASRGVSVILEGEDLLGGAVTMQDAELTIHHGDAGMTRMPLAFREQTFKDGKVRLIAEQPEVPLLPIPPGLPDLKRLHICYERGVSVNLRLKAVNAAQQTFAPIDVYMFPLENREGVCGWQCDVMTCEAHRAMVFQAVNRRRTKLT